MEEVQVGNADINSAPESFISDDASEDFFGRLEQEVNGVIVDDIETKTSTVESTQSDNMQEVEAETSEANTEDIETLKKGIQILVQKVNVLTNAYLNSNHTYLYLMKCVQTKI